MSKLILRDVSRRYGAVEAVADFSLEMAPGEFVSLLGPSGCGKTTTLRMIAGFLPPSAGMIKLAGRTIDDLPAHRRNIGYVFQNYALFPHLNVYENVAFGLRRSGANEDEVRTRVTEMLTEKLPGGEARDDIHVSMEELLVHIGDSRSAGLLAGLTAEADPGFCA
jgi:ABC-type Fe3+/spermidine/putrescine transport system ATPase subunit